MKKLSFIILTLVIVYTGCTKKLEPETVQIESLVDFQLSELPDAIITVDLMKVKGGTEFDVHTHKDYDAFVWILNGELQSKEIISDSSEIIKTYKTGEVSISPLNTTHSVSFNGDTEILRIRVTSKSEKENIE